MFFLLLYVLFCCIIYKKECLRKIKTVRIDLYEVRKEKRLTQKELARKAGVSQSTISAIENYSKSPSIATVNKIAIALNVDTMKLISEE